MSEFLSFYDSVMVDVTKEHLKVFENFRIRKETLEQAHEAKQRRFAEKLARTDNRAAILEKRRRIEHFKTAAKRKSFHEKFLVQLDITKEIQFYKRLKLITAMKKRDKQKLEKMAKFKRHQLRVKRRKEIKRYLAMVDEQKTTIQNTNALIDKCIEEAVSDETIHLEEINEIEEEIEIEPESSEHCSFYQVSKIKMNIESSCIKFNIFIWNIKFVIVVIFFFMACKFFAIHNKFLMFELFFFFYITLNLMSYFENISTITK